MEVPSKCDNLWAHSPEDFEGTMKFLMCANYSRMGNDSSCVPVIIYVTVPWENVNGRALNYSF